MGRSLDDLGYEFSWDDFAAFVRLAPPESALAASALGEAMWPRTDVLLATVIDTLRGANWQRGHGKGPRPKPIPVPGYGKEEKKYGTPHEVDSVHAYLEARNGRAPEMR